MEQTAVFLLGTALLLVTAIAINQNLKLKKNIEQGKLAPPIDRVAALREILDVLPDAAAVVDSQDRVLASSSNCVAMGLVIGDRLGPIELRALNREVNRLGKSLSRETTIGQSANGLGGWEARLQLSPLDEELSLLIAQDLSEERRLNEVRRDFVANVSHELKTPVGALALLAEAVQSADTDIEQVRHFSSRMQIEVARLIEMIADLVELSRVQGDTAMRHSEPVSVHNLISAAVDDVRVVASEHQIELTVAESLDVGLIFGDERQLVTAIRNLLSNAINYSPKGTKVGIGARIVEESIEISVTDQGPGIPEAELSRIFERFYRVDPARSRDTGGTGLGLAIVKHVCANHGGDCFVWSSVGQGSTFTLKFPTYVNGLLSPTEGSQS